MHHITLFSALFVCACAGSVPDDPVPKVTAGHIERLPQFPSEFVTPRHVDVWLPEGYSPDQRYPVLYMHDGQMLFDPSDTWNGQEWGVDEVLTDLIHTGTVEPVIVVGIWNAGPERHSDYFPQKAWELLPRSFRDSLANHKRPGEETPLYPSGIRSDAYLRFLVEELKPYIDRRFATRPGREHTFIAGSSMGGLISMYAQCEYPDVFGGAACLSTHWTGIFRAEDNPIPNALIDYLSTHLPPPDHHRWYFDYGTETLDALYEPFQLRVDSVMQATGYTATNWMTRKFPGADHSERAWRERLHVPVVFLLGK